MKSFKDVSGNEVPPFIDIRVSSKHENSWNNMVLRHTYICRRAIGNLPFMFDLIAHSAQLFDAYTAEQVEHLKPYEPPGSEPVTRFLFERFEDRIDPVTKQVQPHVVIREIDISQPYRLWYQKPPNRPITGRSNASWYQFDDRSYECFDLDGYYWTKQMRGTAVNTTVGELVELTEMLIRNPYDVGRHTCHDARELVMQALGVEKGSLRAFTRMTEFMRPGVSVVKGSSESLSKSSTSNGR